LGWEKALVQSKIGKGRKNVAGEKKNKNTAKAEKKKKKVRKKPGQKKAKGTFGENGRASKPGGQKRKDFHLSRNPSRTVGQRQKELASAEEGKNGNRQTKKKQSWGPKDNKNRRLLGNQLTKSAVSNQIQKRKKSS